MIPIKVGDTIDFSLAQPVKYTAQGVVKKIWRSGWLEIYVPMTSNAPCMIALDEVTAINACKVN